LGRIRYDPLPYLLAGQIDREVGGFRDYGMLSTAATAATTATSEHDRASGHERQETRPFGSRAGAFGPANGIALTHCAASLD